MVHANPNPRNTLTEFEPVTLVMAASARSGNEVPNATHVMAVTSLRRPTMQQPKTNAPAQFK